LNSQNFEGDLLLVETPDGGNILIEGGMFVNDKTFNTAVYLSLFGGNKEDAGKVKNNQAWWGNLLPDTAEAEKLISRFQAVILGLPMSTKNILEAEKAAILDLQWIIDAGIAEAVDVDGNAVGKNSFSLRVKASADGTTVYDNTFSLFWKAGIYGV
jgi:phage gp46-like protein